LHRIAAGERGADGGEAPADVDFLAGCAVCVRRDVVEATGGLDPAYYLNYEDVDWCVRVQRAGRRVVSVPGARVWHKTSASLGIGSPRNTYYMTRNGMLFFARHGKGFGRVMALLCILARTLRTVGAWTLKPVYHTEVFRRKRDANLLAIRDFALGRLGKMGADVERRCCPET
jgi:GT2 family glycosyltransferase